MRQVIDEKGRVTLPATFQPGDSVELQIASDNKLVISKTGQVRPGEVKLVQLPGGFTAISGLPPIDSEGVKRLLEEFP